MSTMTEAPPTATCGMCGTEQPVSRMTVVGEDAYCGAVGADFYTDDVADCTARWERQAAERAAAEYADAAVEAQDAAEADGDHEDGAEAAAPAKDAQDAAGDANT